MKAARRRFYQPDGKRFLVMLPEAQTQDQPRPPLQVNIVLNWFEELSIRGIPPRE